MSTSKFLCFIGEYKKEVDIFMPPTLKKVWGAYCFWLVCSFIRTFIRSFVCSFVRHAFWCRA